MSVLARCRESEWLKSEILLFGLLFSLVSGYGGFACLYIQWDGRGGIVEVWSFLKTLELNRIFNFLEKKNLFDLIGFHCDNISLGGKESMWKSICWKSLGVAGNEKRNSLGN